jgi:hypothetical protein
MRLTAVDIYSEAEPHSLKACTPPSSTSLRRHWAAKHMVGRSRRHEILLLYSQYLTQDYSVVDWKKRTSHEAQTMSSTSLDNTGQQGYILQVLI